MDLVRANQIMDRVEDLLANPDYLPGGFNALSRTGAKTRAEIFHAACLVTAQLFQSENLRGKGTGEDSDFSDFVRALDSTIFTVLFLRPCLPDAELDLICKLLNNSAEYRREEERLQELALKDGAINLEKIESFVEFLRSIDFSDSDYWPHVYGRICLVCPTHLIPTSAARNAAAFAKTGKPWWRFW